MSPGPSLPDRLAPRGPTYRKSGEGTQQPRTTCGACGAGVFFLFAVTEKINVIGEDR